VDVQKAGLMLRGDADPKSRDLRFSYWQSEFEAAVIETDSEKLHRHIEAAEGAIFVRLQELVENSDGHAERQAISDAIRTLRVLRTEKPHYPDWNKK
jgi:hypothetical protein